MVPKINLLNFENIHKIQIYTFDKQTKPCGIFQTTDTDNQMECNIRK